MTATIKDLSQERSWILDFPIQISVILISGYLVGASLFTCDSTVTIARGDSLLHILVCFAIGFFVAIDSIIFPNRFSIGRAYGVFLLGAMAFAGWVWLSTLVRGSVGNARFSLNGCFQWISQCVLLVSIARLCHSPRVSRQLILIGLACFGGAIAFSLHQYFITLPRDRAAFAADKDGFLRQQDIVPGTAQAMLYENRLGSLEPSGPFVLTNSLAGFLLTWLVILVGWLAIILASRQKDARTNPLGLMVTICALLMAGSYSIVLTSSRSAWLAMLAGVIGIGFFSFREIGLRADSIKRNQLRNFGIACFAASLLVVIGIVAWKPSLLESATKSFAYRLEYWEATWKLILQKPWFGYGSCNFQSYYTHVKAMTASESPADPHHWMFELLFSGGFPMLGLVGAWFVTSAMALSKRTAQENLLIRFDETEPIPHLQLVSIMGAGSICLGCLLVFGTAIGIDSIGQFMSFFLAGSITWCFLAWFSSRSRTEGAKRITPWPLPRPVFVVACLALMVHLSAAGGWMLPGPMVPLVLCVGILVGSNPATRETLDPNQVASPPFAHAGKRSFLSGTSLLFLALCIGWGADFVVRMANPILASSKMQFEVADGRFASQGAEAWLRLMAIDRFDPSLARVVANQAAESLMRRDLSDSIRKDWKVAFSQSCKEYLERDEGNWPAAAEVGRWELLIADSLPSNIFADEIETRKRAALNSFLKAAELNPSSAASQLQAAIAAAWCKDQEELRIRLEKVNQIDTVTPHLDRKVVACVVYFPISLERLGKPFSSSERSKNDPISVRGEPARTWLRMVEVQ